MSWEWRKARRYGVGLFVGVAGGSGSGKTYSALKVAHGLAGPGKRIAAIDTEARRMSHYSDVFDFDVVDMKPPFRPDRFADAAKAAEEAGYGALVIDSFSLEWTGEGGVLDWAAEELKRMGGGNNVKLASYIAPKMAHKAMLNSFLQRSIPIVFCLRAQQPAEKVGGRIELGPWTPIQDKMLKFELTTLLTLDPAAPGQVRLALPHKIQSQHAPIFPEGALIGEDMGEALRAWANSDGAAPDRVQDGVRALLDRVDLAADAAGLRAILDDPATVKQRAWLAVHRPELAAQVTEVTNAALANIKGA